MLRTTQVQDQLAHLPGYSDIDEPSGTWTGLACPCHRLTAGADVDTAPRVGCRIAASLRLD